MADDFPLSPDDVSEIVAILSGSGYDRLDISTTRFRLRVSREGEGWSQDWNWNPAGETTIVTVSAAVSVTTEVEADGGLAIRATLPGTFYRAPQPGAPPFVDIGAVVEADTVVGIIETMKLMTPVHAGAAGVVEAILIDNATMVESGVVLIQLRPLA